MRIQHISQRKLHVGVNSIVALIGVRFAVALFTNARSTGFMSCRDSTRIMIFFQRKVFESSVLDFIYFRGRICYRNLSRWKIYRLSSLFEAQQKLILNLEHILFIRHQNWHLTKRYYQIRLIFNYWHTTKSIFYDDRPKDRESRIFQGLHCFA